MEFRNYMRLLALAQVPEEATSILEWTPFADGDSLDEIIYKHNLRCVESYRRRGWDRYWIERLAEVIKAAPYDLSSVSELAFDEFATIYILLVDLDAIETTTTEIDHVRNGIARHDHQYHMAQVSQMPSAAVPCTPHFPTLPIITSEPEILPDQGLFEEFLRRLCKGYRKIIAEMRDQPPPGDVISAEALVVNEAYFEALPKRAREIRDFGMSRGLSEEETAALARQVAMQEHILAHLAGQVSTENLRIIALDPVRQPVDEIPVGVTLQEPRMKQENVIRLSLAGSLRDLTTRQRHLVASLGLKGKTFAVLHPDQPTIWDQIESLRGAVEAKIFPAEIPYWE